MTCVEARHYLWREPFEPVRIRLKDGRIFDIPDRLWAMAAEAVLIVGIPPEDEPNSRLPDRGIWIRWPEVDTIKPLVEVVPRRIGMTCDEARHYLWRKPFQPVRIRLKDGRTFDIPRRGWTLAAEALLMIGIPPKDEPNSRLPDRGIHVQWADVDAIEPLPEPVAPSV